MRRSAVIPAFANRNGIPMDHDIWDGAWKLMQHDAPTGRSVWMTLQDEQYVFRVDMPLDDIFDVNREMEAVSHGQRFGDYNRIASVPHHLVHKTGLADAVRQRDDGFLKRFFNDSDFRKFRTSRGSV